MRPPKWCCALTTVLQRRTTTLPRTLASLEAAGFPKPRLCVDGCGPEDAAAYGKEFGLEVTNRHPVIRVHGSFCLGLYELWVRNAAADRFLMVQDDVVFSRNVRQYLDRVPYHERTYLNLFSFSSNEAIVRGQPPGTWHEASLVGGGATYHGKKQQTGRGALALVFDREAVITLLSHRHLVVRPMDAQMGWKRIDGGIVESMNQAGWREMVHMPSLVDHIGHPSSIGNRPFPQAATFRGEEFDALTLLEAGA